MTDSNEHHRGLLARLQRRGVLRVAASYAVIAWLLLQIADVVLEPLGAPAWVMQALIVAVVVGFPVAVVLAWFYELTPDGIQRDHTEAGAERPIFRNSGDSLRIYLLLTRPSLTNFRVDGRC